MYSIPFPALQMSSLEKQRQGKGKKIQTDIALHRAEIYRTDINSQRDGDIECQKYRLQVEPKFA